MKLAEKIVRLRKARGMSQEALAEQLGVSRQAVSRWEVGSALPDAGNVLQLSRLFGVTADYLLDDEYAGERETVSGSPVRKSSIGLRKIVGLCTGGFGLLLNLVIYVLSRFIEVMVPHVTHENGETWYTYSSSITARSYKYFVQEYKLELLVALFWILTAAGLVIAFVPKEKLARTAEKIKGLWKRMQKEVERF